MSDEEFSQRITAMTQTLFRVCYAQLRQPCDREDAVQETLRKCWQKRGQLRDERYLQTWVVRVLLNECHSIQRRSARVQPAEQLPERAVSPQPMGQGRLHDALLALGKAAHAAGAVLHGGLFGGGNRLHAARPAGNGQNPPAQRAAGAEKATARAREYDRRSVP